MGVPTREMAIPKPYTKKRYYVLADLKEQSCCVALFGKVFDLSALIGDNQGSPLCVPLIEAAGTDITHWFDAKTTDPKTFVDPYTNMEDTYCPLGRYLHVPSAFPEPGLDTRTLIPWWKDEVKYCIGKLASGTIKINVCNLLTKQTVGMMVPVEETLKEIQDRYETKVNFHAKAYTWKRLSKPLQMDLTLTENGIEDETAELQHLGIDPDDHTLTLHLYFNDDLTES